MAGCLISLGTNLGERVENIKRLPAEFSKPSEQNEFDSVPFTKHRRSAVQAGRTIF